MLTCLYFNINPRQYLDKKNLRKLKCRKINKCEHNAVYELLNSIYIKNINLKKLYYVECNITSLISLNISELTTKLVIFDCWGNKEVKKIPKQLISLKILCCGNTCIEKIPNTLVNLIYLECYNLKITKIPKNLINLNYLDIYNTSIKKIPKTLINLTYLVCSNTQIKKIPNTLINLKYLDCKGSLIQKISNCLIDLNEIISYYPIIRYW